MDWPRLKAGLKAVSPRLLLPIILLVALGLRLYGIDWDQGHGFHPDERSIYMQSDCMYRVLTESPGYVDCLTDPDKIHTEPGIPGPHTFLDADKSPLNPHWFPLGSILIYLIVAIRFVLEPFTDLGSLERMSYVGRSIMALADVGTVFMVYLLGKKIYGSRAGLLAAALVALAVVHIQHSHFYRPEPLLVFFLMVSFWFMLQVMERRRLRDSVLLGLFVGLAVAPKVSVLPLVLPLAVAYGSRLLTTPEGRWSLASSRDASVVAGHALLAGAIALGVFFFTMPYALLDFGDFVDQTTFQANMARTAGTVPFTVQYIGSTPFLYELKQTTIWALGLPLGIVAWGGLLFTISVALYRLVKTRWLPRWELLVLAWVLPNFLLLGFFEVKFLRYIFPIIPFLVLMGSGMLVWMLERARGFSLPPMPVGDATDRLKVLAARYAPRVVVGTIAFVIAATAFYALAFERVYAKTHPAIEASRWINANVPPGSTIVTDNHWDEGIPDIYRYTVTAACPARPPCQIPIYEPDTQQKMRTIADYLSRGDYLVFYGNRTYGSVARVPDRYPMSARYYQLLFAEKLGYRLERAFTSYPQLFGVAFVDDTFSRAGIPEPSFLKGLDQAPVSLNLGYADENVIGYDHPKVLLFRNVEHLPWSDLRDLLTERLPEESPQLGLMLSPEEKASQRQGGTWSEIIKRGSWTNTAPVLAWLLLVELIYLSALPLATFLFRPLPDRGIILARILGILGVSYVAWLLASAGWMGFSRTSVLVGILVIASLSSVVLATRWREFKEFLTRNWRLLAIGEVLFLAAFLSFVAIRMANPDLWHPYRGGEKPMDFAYLNAVLRSTSMPPYDPWFAGGYLNYYYWGQFIVATLIKATGILPSVAYNLAVPLFFALTVTGAYSLVYNVTAGIRRLSFAPGGEGPPSVGGGSEPIAGDLRYPGGPAPPGRWRLLFRDVAWGPVIAGLVAGLFVAVMGNLDGIVQLAQGSWKSVVGDEVFPAFDFWRSSRMLPQLEEVTPSALTFWLPDRVFPNPEIGFHITEFPFFSFLFADLHAHMIAIPFTLLAIGLALNILVGMRAAGRWWLAAAATALALALGALWAINSWDYPTYVLLSVAGIGAGAYLARGKPLARLALFLALAAGTVVMSILAFLPFHLDYHPYPTGLVVSRWQTPLHHYLAIHGVFFFVTLSFLGYLAWDRRAGLRAYFMRPPLIGHGLSRFWDAPASTLSGMRLGAPAWTSAAVAIGVGAVLYMAITGYWTAAALTLVLGLTFWAGKDVLSSRGERSSFVLFPLGLLALALLIGIGVEFVRAEDDIGRMNTLFKYYLEVWVLFGLSSACMLWYLGSRGAFRPRAMSLLRGGWLAALALLLASSFIYTILGTRARLADRFDTQFASLDGAEYMDRAVYSKEGPAMELKWDYGAIRWLQDNVRGSPVVLEAHNEQYSWSSRISNYTGLPTVLGWPWHQIQQRMKYDYAVRGRSAVVKEIYSTRDVQRALELLRLYEVEYVVVGELEGAYYPSQGLRKFDTMASTGLARIVYQNEGVRIYQGLWYN